MVNGSFSLSSVEDILVIVIVTVYNGSDLGLLYFHLASVDSPQLLLIILPFSVPFLLVGRSFQPPVVQ